MKLASLIILISTLCFTALAMPEEWPQTAKAPRVYGRRNTPTNAELLQRGLTPSRPRKMYNARALQARQAIPSAPATAANGERVYRFVECRNGFAFDGSSNVLTFTDVQDLANKCAALQDSEGRQDPQQFGIRNARGVTNCWTAALDDPDVDEARSCDSTDSNFAVYSTA